MSSLLLVPGLIGRALLPLAVLFLVACDSGATPAPPAAPSALPPALTPAPTVARPATAVAAATATATSAPLPPAPTAAPSPTATLSPTAVPPPKLIRLTEPNCCTQPTWSPDSRLVQFIDKPDKDAPVGIYAVDIANPGKPRLLTERIAFYTSDMQYVLSYDTTFVTVERLSDGQKWRVRTGGRSVSLSPDRKRVIWSETPQTGPLESRLTTIHIANLDGGDQHVVTSRLRAGASWLDNQRLLMTARQDRNSQEVSLYVYSLVDGSMKVLAKAERIRNMLASPGGQWIAYSIAFDKNPALNGIWLVPTAGGEPRKVDFFGSFQWRDSHRLVYVPLELDTPSHEFHEYDAATGRQRRLTNPAAAPFYIGNGDWLLSPDGKKIVFLHATDLNLWLWTFND